MPISKQTVYPFDPRLGKILYWNPYYISTQKHMLGHLLEAFNEYHHCFCEEMGK